MGSRVVFFCWIIQVLSLKNVSVSRCVCMRDVISECGITHVLCSCYVIFVSSICCS